MRSANDLAKDAAGSSTKPNSTLVIVRESGQQDEWPPSVLIDDEARSVAQGEPGKMCEQKEKRHFNELLGLLDDWTWRADDAPKQPCVMACRNALIADFTIVLAGCIKSNAVPLCLGAGAGSKAAAMYQIKSHEARQRLDLCGGNGAGRLAQATERSPHSFEC